MYLAPLNYDRFFQRIFKDLAIAKRFFEDFLNVEITFFEPLPRKNKMTDDAAFVEFDYRCRINGKYYILDMQQWYKRDVIRRFYLYFCNNTSLQLETMTSVSVPMPNGVVYKTKDYEQLEPTITLIWMADDALGFTEDTIAYSMFPESINAFIQNDNLWSTGSKKDLLAEHKKILKTLNNKHKNMDFLSENRLIFMLQPNIVRNKIMTKYFDWFEFASKTKNKNNVAADFKKYRKDKIFSTMIQQLRTTVLEDDDFQYIEDYDEYMIGVQNYNNKIKREALKEADELFKVEREQAKLEREQAKLEREQEREQERQKQKNTVRNMRQRGFAIEFIADITELSISEINAFFEEFDKKK
jgi:hypothetical protein